MCILKELGQDQQIQKCGLWRDNTKTGQENEKTMEQGGGAYNTY